MAAREIKTNIWSVGALDWDRQLFDELIPLPEGTTYNSYLIKGTEKTALLDTVDPSKTPDLLDNLSSLGVKQIDYIIAHHAEQDHSGSIPVLLTMFPQAKVVTNIKCKGMLQEHILISDDKFMVIEDRQTLSLGAKNLEFILAPWVHWPETMLTFLKEDKILFTCDFFGSHLAQGGLLVGESAAARQKVLRAAKRYYAEIMMPFRTSIKKHLETLKAYEICLIAPSHGPVYPDPELIIKAYRKWISDEVKNEVVIAYVSMHSSTRAMIDYLLDALIKRGLIVKPFNLPRTDMGELAMALVDAATVVVGAPTVLAGAHPEAVYAAYLLNSLRPKVRYLSIVGSYGWGGKMVEQLSGLLSNIKAEIIPPVIIKGYPKAADLTMLEVLADAILAKHQNDDLVRKEACNNG
ncbi:FprA family A-type flavoprotein [Candidatus Saganbacteria bacterium]|nr:FprA family A-type flavoprotein [Candidatus Saganbacteria bacterium]